MSHKPNDNFPVQLVRSAVNILKSGGILIFPTDTAYGIGCLMSQKSSVRRLFALRKRPETQAMPVLVSSPDMAIRYYDHPDLKVLDLMAKYWPGALTIVSNCKTDLIYAPVRGYGKTIGLRMPRHSGILSVISACGEPLLGPSANFHGDDTPFTLDDVNPTLKKAVDMVLPGLCSAGIVSTVVECTGNEIRVLRHGAVTV